MFATHGTALQLEHVRTVLLLAAIGIVVFWRVMLRVLIAAIVVAAGAGAFLLLQALHR